MLVNRCSTSPSTSTAAVDTSASTSGDVLGRRGALAAVLEAEPLLKRGILELLALDYECFGYEMPMHVSKG